MHFQSAILLLLAGLSPGQVAEVAEGPVPASLSARIATIVTPGRACADVSTLLQYTVEGAGLRAFRFAVPESAAERVHIEAVDSDAQILERRRDEPDQAGWATWTVTMNRRIVGRQRFRISWSLPVEQGRATRAQGDSAEAPSRRFVLTPLRVLPPEDKPPVLRDVAGEIVVIGDPSSSMTVDLIGPGVERVAPGDLQFSSKEAALAFRHGNQPAELAVGITETEIVPSVGTIVSNGLIEIALARSGPAEYRCRFRIGSGLRWLPIQLPAGVDVLEASIDGAPAHLRRSATPEEGYEAFVVDLGRLGHSIQKRLLELRFRIPPDSAVLSRRRGSVRVPLPILGNRDEVALEEVRTVVAVPEGLDVLGVPVGFTRLESSGRAEVDEQWSLSRTESLLSHSTGHGFQSVGLPDAMELVYWDRRFATWILSGAVLLIALLLRPTTWENRVTVVLLAGVVLSLLSLGNADAVLQGCYAARWGIMAGLMIWVTSAAWHRSKRMAGKQTGDAQPIAAAILPAAALNSRLERLRRGA